MSERDCIGLRHGQLVLGRVEARSTVEQLTLNVSEQRAGSEAKEVRLGPVVT